MAWEELLNDNPEDLVEYIQLKDDPDYAEMAKNAFYALTYRFQKDLLMKFIPVCENWGYDQTTAIEIGYKVFDKVWKHASFKMNKAKQKDPHKAFLFYLVGIAKRELADYKSFLDGNISPFTGDEQIIWEFPDIEAISETPERKAILLDRYELIKKALGRLTPKHKVIYLTYKQYEHELKDGNKLPRELLKSLRSELDLSQNSVRVYKNEAFKIVDEYLKVYGSK